MGLVIHGYRDAGKLSAQVCRWTLLTAFSIVEFQTRDEAQQAVNTLSNQNLMGRLVYVREVRKRCLADG